MSANSKRHSMVEALKDRDEVRAFLDDGKTSHRRTKPNPTPMLGPKIPDRRIAVTARLPEEFAHALIDASAERRKNREKVWSQQDIIAEALAVWFRSRKS